MAVADKPGSSLLSWRFGLLALSPNLRDFCSNFVHLFFCQSRGLFFVGMGVGVIEVQAVMACFLKYFTQRSVRHFSFSGDPLIPESVKVNLAVWQ